MTTTASSPQVLLDQVAFLDQRIAQLEAGAIATLAAAMPEAWGVDATGPPARTPAPARTPPVLPAVARLAEIPGISVWPGPCHHRRDRPGHDPRSPPPPTWCPGPGCARPPASPAPGTARPRARKARATPARGGLGQAAIGAARTATFLGERYARIARRRGKANAQVAVARSILIIIWHLLSDPSRPVQRPRPGLLRQPHQPGQKIRNHIQGLQALGVSVTITADEQAA